MAIPGASRRCALVITGHPDDETICMGGTIALLAARGVQVTLCSATRGEGGETGEPPVCRREDLGVCREAELRRAAAVLGAAGVAFLGYIDPRAEPSGPLSAATTDLAEHTARILDLLRLADPGIVFTHGANGEYGHPQHAATHDAVLAAWRRWRRRGASLYTFAAAAGPGRYFSSFRNDDDPPSVEVDIAAVIETKHRAFACHASQAATTLKDAGRTTVDGMFPPWEAFRRRRGPARLEQWLALPKTPASTRGTAGLPRPSR